MTFHYRYRKQIIITIIVVLIVSSLTITTIYFYEPKKEKKISSLKVKKTSNPIKEDTLNQKENKKYMVDIKGEVQTPGIYELESSSRVIDVINEAGGLTENADTTVINLSKKISDEMVIIIYSKWQVEHWKETKEQGKYLQEQCISQKEEQAKNDACIDDTEENTNSTPSIININTATKEELMTLTGIGESKAEAIISYREKTAFTKIEDIKNVSGIGDSIYEDIKNNITV
ncbi:MAG: helix-hairpin-helix domain-containing protein [bacterium]|nr:helix-hairpin-helix domain-containing protein [Mycoplasmatota bacterium]MDD6756984.1 helix-hairpin-helix domain-containing protein [bacterium]MDY2908398.1 helix-hairpin-helix domain-containing protein [Candidatus Faecimonas sp.]